MPGRDERGSLRNERGREIGEKMLIEARPIAEPPRALSPKPGQSTCTQLRPRAARCSAKGRISSRLETVLRVGSSSTARPTPSVSYATSIGRPRHSHGKVRDDATRFIRDRTSRDPRTPSCCGRGQSRDDVRDFRWPLPPPNLRSRPPCRSAGRRAFGWDANDPASHRR